MLWFHRFGRCVVVAMLSLASIMNSACSRPKSASLAGANAPAGAVEPNPLRNAYFGDLHVHTTYSFDAFVCGTRTTPDDACRYAKGETIEHPAGFKLRLASGPLDFLAVTDHAEFLGAATAMTDLTRGISKHPLAGQITGADTVGGSPGILYGWGRTRPGPRVLQSGLGKAEENQ